MEVRGADERASDQPNEKASPERVLEVLTKAVPGASLHRIPRHPDHRDITLAILCLSMRRRYPYSELEINEFFRDRMTRLNGQVDHVTCRRYMVDLGFVKRDRAGSRYFLNYPKLEATLSNEARESAEELIDRALANCKRKSVRPGGHDKT